MSQPIAELVADVLHRVAGGRHSLMDVQEGCYCRRIATVDGTTDGPQDPIWSSIGEVYDPAEWGETSRPTTCEHTAIDLVDELTKVGIHLVVVDRTNPDGR